MKTVSYSELRQNLASMIDRVNDDHEPIVIMHSGKPTAVLMSLEDFASYEETKS